MGEKKQEINSFAAGFGAGLIAQNKTGSMGNIIGMAIVANEAEKVLAKKSEASAREPKVYTLQENCAAIASAASSEPRKMNPLEWLILGPIALVWTAFMFLLVLTVYVAIPALFLLALYVLMGWWCILPAAFVAALAVL